MEGQFWEEFQRGAFAKSIKEKPSGFKLNMLHDTQGRLPIGVSVLSREDALGLFQEFRVSKTAAGDEVLALAADGVPLGLSIGFRPVKDRWSDDKSRVWRLEAALRETSIVNEPAYQDAMVTGVRYRGLDPEDEDVNVEAATPEPTPDDEVSVVVEPDTSPDEPPQHSTDPNSLEARHNEIAPYIDWLNKQKGK
jgi:HK97 family phage prohead protease